MEYVKVSSGAIREKLNLKDKAALCGMGGHRRQDPSSSWLSKSK